MHTKHTKNKKALTFEHKMHTLFYCGTSLTFRHYTQEPSFVLKEQGVQKCAIYCAADIHQHILCRYDKINSFSHYFVTLKTLRCQEIPTI